MKIIHLSDLHLKPGRYARTNCRFKKIVKKLNGGEFDGSEFIIITGDLIESALEHRSMERARELIALLGHKFKNIMVCSGNHDYGNFWGGDPRYMAPFFATFAAWMTSNTPIPEHTTTGGEKPPGSPFPIVNLFGDHLFIGLDSMEGEFEQELNSHDGTGWDWWAEGEIGVRQRDALHALLEDSELKTYKSVVYLHHHPYRKVLEWNRLRDADLFTPIVRDRAGLLMFGHNHHYEKFERGETFDQVDMALEGGSIKPNRDIRFRLIDYSGEKPETREIVIKKRWWNILFC